jgi:hypothetical protein
LARKNIGATLSIKDNNFTVGIKKAITGTNNLKTHTTNATGSLKKMSTQGNLTGQSLASLAKNAVGVVAAYAGFRQIVQFGKEAIEAADGQYKAEARLEQLMGNVKGTTAANIDGIKKYASELQALTTVGDEAAMTGASQLATFQLQSSSIKQLMPALNDLAVGTYGVNVSEEQMQQSANLLGKVFTGQVGALTRVGVTFNATQESILKNGTEAEKTAALVDVLKQNYGGLAQKMAATPTGRIIQLKNAWGDVQEEIGMRLYPAITSLFGWVATKIPRVQSIIIRALDSVKPPLVYIKNSILPPLVSILKNIWDYGVSAFNNIRAAVENNMPKFEALKGVLVDIKDKLIIAFDSAKPVLNWLKDTGIPFVVDAIGTVIQKSAKLYNYINDNWTQIEPIVKGIAGAVLTYKAALVITNTWTKIVSSTTAIWTGAVNLWKAAKAGALGVEIAYSIWRTKDIIQTGILIALYTKDAIIKGILTAATWVQVAATAALTAGQWLLNAAFLASPIGWVVLGIGLIVGAFVLLWKKCEPFRNFFLGMWDAFKAKLDQFGGGFKGFVNIIISGVNGLIGKFIGGINGMIDGVNSISGHIGIPAIPSIPVPQIPMLAQGGIIRRAGSVIVGEKGPEMLTLPRGAGVAPIPSSSKTENHITINVYADGKSAEEIINEVVPRLKLALSNL